MKDLGQVFDELKTILAVHADDMNVISDTPENYYLNTSKTDEKGKPVFFGMVKVNKQKVAFHLMPVYCEPALLDGLSDELRKRMQGKSCFNFTQSSPELFTELGELTQAGFDSYKAAGKI